MNRRHYLALAGSVTFAGCSGDPSGIISEDNSGSNNTESDSILDSNPSLTETTIEGTGRGLHEITIENDGITFFQIDTSEPIIVSLVSSEDGSSSEVGFNYPDVFTKTFVGATPGEYALEIEAESDLSWSITIEDHPIYTDDQIGETDFPIEFSGESVTAYGPFVFDGFIQPHLRTNSSMTLQFMDQTGEILHTPSVDVAYGDYEESFASLDTLNISNVCWLYCYINPTYSGVQNSENIFYDVRIIEPENS